MTNKIVRLIEKCKSFEPLEGRILVHPLKVKTYKAKEPMPVRGDMTVDEMQIGEKEVDVKMVERDVMYRYQRAIVLQVANDEIRFTSGNIIIYNVGALHTFDLIKDVSLLRKYDVVAIENE